MSNRMTLGVWQLAQGQVREPLCSELASTRFLVALLSASMSCCAFPFAAAERTAPYLVLARNSSNWAHRL